MMLLTTHAFSAMRRPEQSRFAGRAYQTAALLLLGLTLATPRLELQAADFATPRQRVSFDADWFFIKGDPTNSEAKLDYTTLKPFLLAAPPEFNPLSGKQATRPEGSPGADAPYAQTTCDESAWRKVTLPHDWGIEGPFKQEYSGETGKLPWWGVAWYRKHFQLSPDDAGKQIYLDVDGAMAYAAVWVNGNFAGGWPYGYSSWRVDLTPFVTNNVDNIIAIRLDNPPSSSRWYPGGGIYRNVWLVKTAPVHVSQWGTFITTPQVSRNAATVEVKVSVDNRGDKETSVQVDTQIYEVVAEGQKLGRPVAVLGPVALNLAPNSSGSATMTNVIHNPHLWGLKSPNRYLAITALTKDGRIIDNYDTSFGVRTIQFTTDNGFLLNGERVALNGVCDHHDLGALGSAINTRALERQIDLLQEMGCNAIRTSHNPPAPEMLDLCDRKGMVVMDEAFDCWVRGKTRNDYHLLFPDWHERDLRALIRRDRNHPCVILWSIGNEVPEQGSPAGHQVAHELAGIVRSEDVSRPVTSACNNTRAGYNGFQKELDVFGYNYKPREYGKFREANADEPLFGSETASCVSSRGEYFFPVSNDKGQGRANFQVSSYDLYAPAWATPPDTEFKGQDEFPFVAGEFVWTGFDYIGEPTPYNADSSNLLNFTDPAEKAKLEKELKELGKIKVPSRSSYFGILDLAGFKKDRFYIYQARWRPDFHMAHILPHWTWPERVGQVTPVHVYTSGDEAELFLNGRSLGKKKRGPYDYRIRWDDVVYEPGTLSVVVSKGHSAWAHDAVATAGPAAKLALHPDRSTIRADRDDLSFVTVEITDRDGRLEPRAKNHVNFGITGPGEIMAVDNGDATSFEPFQATAHSAYNGLCLVVVRSTGEPGTILLKAASNALKPAEVKITAKAANSGK